MTIEKKNIIRTVFIFLIYLCYTNLFVGFFDFIGFADSLIATFIADLIFFLLIVIVYREKIHESFLSFWKYSWKKKIGTVILGVIVIFGINMLGGMITEAIFPNQEIDGNTDAIYQLASISTFYTIFKTLIFSSIAEVLVFEQSVRDVLKKHNVLFIITSAFIYGLMNIAYVNLDWISLVDFIQCVVFSVIISWIYLKHDDNIFLVMLIKFVYTLIPLTILLAEIGA